MYMAMAMAMAMAMEMGDEGKRKAEQKMIMMDIGMNYEISHKGVCC